MTFSRRGKMAGHHGPGCPGLGARARSVPPNQVAPRALRASLCARAGRPAATDRPRSSRSKICTSRARARTACRVRRRRSRPDTSKVMRRAVARVLSNPAERDEVIQDARRVLLVGSADGAPKIGTYWDRGRSRLGGGRGDSAGHLAWQGRKRRAAAARAMSDDALGSNPELLLVKGKSGASCRRRSRRRSVGSRSASAWSCDCGW